MQNIEILEPLKILADDTQIKELNISDDVKQDIIRDIEVELDNIKEERSKYNLEEKWQKERDNYDGVMPYKDFPWENSSNNHIQIIKRKVKVVKNKGKKQMFLNPMILLKGIPGVKYDIADKDKKEEWLNYKLLDSNEIDFPNKVDATILDGILHDVGWLKVYYGDKTEVMNIVKTYKPEEISLFEDDLVDVKDSDEYRKAHSDLIENRTVSITVRARVKVGTGIQVDYVDIKDLYCRVAPKDLELHKLISEKVSYTWLDMMYHFQNDGWDEKVIQDIKGADAQNYDKNTYEVYECIYRYDYDGDGYDEKCVITIIDLNGKKMYLRGIMFPYNHNKIYYVPYRISPVKNFVYGEGMAEMLMNTSEFIDKFWNQSIDTGTLLNAPAFEVEEGSGFDPTLKKWGPAVIWWVKRAGTIKQLNTHQVTRELTEYIDRANRNADLDSGVSDYSSGKESAQDPNAPASKALMLLQESNMQIQEFIDNLHSSNTESVFIISELFKQYKKDSNEFYPKENRNKETKQISMEDIEIPSNIVLQDYRIIPHLSKITINKELEKERNFETLTVIMKLPMWQDPNVQRTAIEIWLRSVGEEWEKNIDVFFPEQPQLPAGLPGQVPTGLVGGAQTTPAMPITGAVLPPTTPPPGGMLPGVTGAIE